MHPALLTTAFRARRDHAEALHLEAALKTVPIAPTSRDEPGRQETFPSPSSNLFARLREQLPARVEQLVYEIFVARWAASRIGRERDFDGRHGLRVARPGARLTNRQQRGRPRILRLEKPQCRKNILHAIGVVAGIEGQDEL